MVIDGAANEDLRFPKTLNVAIDLFQLLELDALIHGVNSAVFQPSIQWKGVWYLFQMTSSYYIGKPSQWEWENHSHQPLKKELLQGCSDAFWYMV